MIGETKRDEAVESCGFLLRNWEGMRQFLRERERERGRERE
jgi:hypothetical protein